MKKEIKIALVISVTLLTLLTMCRYKEGPLISFRSTYKRLEGYWQITKFTSNGIDSLKYYNDSCGSLAWIGNIDLMTSDKEYYIYFNLRESNEFFSALKFNDNKTILYIDFGNTQRKILGPIGNGKSDWKILKLTNKYLKISTTFGGLNYEIDFNKKEN